MEWVLSRVVSSQWVGPADCVITLRSGSAFDGSRPGQFAMVRPGAWTSDPLLPRPLSILWADAGRVSFLIRVVGRGTRLLSQASVGDEWALLGPVGTPYPEPDPGWDWILVAGGVGIAPLLMWAQRHKDIKPVLLYGARTARDLVLVDRALSCSTLEVATQDGSAGRRGLVTDLLRHRPSMGTKSVVLTCGPWAMMAQVASLAEQNGWQCFASLEARMACGRGICLGCSVPARSGEYVTVCRQGPVFDAQAIQWSVGDVEP